MPRQELSQNPFSFLVSQEGQSIPEHESPWETIMPSPPMPVQEPIKNQPAPYAIFPKKGEVIINDDGAFVPSSLFGRQAKIGFKHERRVDGELEIIIYPRASSTESIVRGRIEQGASRPISVESFPRSIIEKGLTIGEEKEFYETATDEEWERALLEFADSPSFDKSALFIDDRRESIYGEREDSQL